MEPKIVCTKRSPKETAGPLNRFFFVWPRKLFYKGIRGDLNLEDLYSPVKNDNSGNVCDRLTQLWESELRKSKEEEETTDYTVDMNFKRKKKPSLGIVILRTFRKDFLMSMVLSSLVYVLLVSILPRLVSGIINYFNVDPNTHTASRTEALLYAAGAMLAMLAEVILMHHGDLWLNQLGMRIRVALCSLIYRKILRLNYSALSETSPGQIISLLANDAGRFDYVVFYCNFLWIGPVQMVLSFILLWTVIGLPTVATYILLFIMIAPILIVSKKLNALREIVASITSKRVEIIHELITGIQVIKMYAWEKPFSKFLDAIRAEELKKITISAYVRAINMAFLVLPNRILVYIIILVCVLLGTKVQSEQMYLLTMHLNYIQLTVAYFFPLSCLMLGEIIVTVNRIEEFLLLEERTDEWISSHDTQGDTVKVNKDEKKAKRIEDAIEIRNKPVNQVEGNAPVSVALNHVYANWLPEKLPPTLSDVTMRVQAGELLALVGSVGSGKSSILYLLLRDLPLGAGSVKMLSNPMEDVHDDAHGYFTDKRNLTISYASQDPWLFSGTVRENILFGVPYDNARYAAVTKACALIRDFQQLPYGDLTHVGENGSSLSGGQKARVNLARAVYKQADVYLLDDPLSAVDAKVAKHLFMRCIRQYLSGKTRILVTHQLQFIKKVDSIAVLDRGRVRMSGSYEQLYNNTEEFLNVIKGIKMSEEVAKRRETGLGSLSMSERRISKRSVGKASMRSTTSSVLSYNYDTQEYSPEEEDEIAATEPVSGSMYVEYFKYGGSYFILALLLLVFVLSQAAVSGCDYWISYWMNVETIRIIVANGSATDTSRYEKMTNDTFLSSIFTLDRYGLVTQFDALHVYTFCVVVSIVFIVVRNFFLMSVCVNASKNIYNIMFWNMLRTTMSFFHRNSAGRILNRFSKDVSTMDELLPAVLLEALQVFFVAFGIVVMIVISCYWMVVPLVVFSVYIWLVRKGCKRIVQRLKYLESVTKSPVFAHINATLHGLSTIRATGPEVTKLLQTQFDQLQDVHTSAWCAMLMTPQAFGVYLDVVAALFVGCLGFIFISLDRSAFLGGDVGLALSQALGALGMLPHGLTRSIETSAYMASVNRLLQYTKLPEEGEWESKNPPPAEWPQHGHLSLKNVSLRYEKDEPPVLQDLNVTIEAGWKVGVVGRTGAGKSSLISALFRLFPDGIQGEIKIDGSDVSQLGLHEFRSKISIIPQQPFLFSDTVRNNLDPFNVYDDAQLWDSLRQVELTDLVLDQKVHRGGSNLSIGQRQLICLARAILKNNRILVLDEATANIDNRTDSLIQETIRTRFVDCTVITVAHRLNTIIDCDRIIVMDAGRIAEFGCPHELLRDKPNGIFSQMVENTGVTMAQTLHEQAEKACLDRKNQSPDRTRKISTDTDSTDVIAETIL
ncbi:ATP-binding cassette sub-family C member 4-like isoform X1 [Nomia melanderi]|uniref:ATP-binding cassette sub-family C member 4-like isoform X1 n=1 Tax=Nomia melanderi TaxID=2448451 RepID=UPI00130448F6|nr:multidrug resistance-associated protein 4-like [Nomia melanderi]